MSSPSSRTSAPEGGDLAQLERVRGSRRHDGDLQASTPPAVGQRLPEIPGARAHHGRRDLLAGHATLALGSAFALFLYPHALTGALSARSGNTIRRNATLLSFYSLMLGII